MASITITEDEFQDLPEEFQQLLLANFLSKAAKLKEGGGGDDDGEGGPPDLSPTLAKKLISNLSPKSKDILRFIANQPVEGFPFAKLEKEMGAATNGLRGALSGITKVTRRLLSDNEIWLIWTVDDGNRTYVSEMTYRSLRKAFGLPVSK